MLCSGSTFFNGALLKSRSYRFTGFSADRKSREGIKRKRADIATMLVRPSRFNYLFMRASVPGITTR